MKNYEVTFIVDPVLSGEEIKATAQTYVDHLTSQGCNIVHVDEMGLRQLAYPINKRSSGVYYCLEFETEDASGFIDQMELALRRDERIMRFLTVALDKYGAKYNSDKRAGLIGKKKKKKSAEAENGAKPAESQGSTQHKTAAPAPAPAPVAAPAAAILEEEE
jgi:small subunit ribosomal protein S6